MTKRINRLVFGIFTIAGVASAYDFVRVYERQSSLGGTLAVGGISRGQVVFRDLLASGGVFLGDGTRTAPLGSFSPVPTQLSLPAIGMGRVVYAAPASGLSGPRNNWHEAALTTPQAQPAPVLRSNDPEPLGSYVGTLGLGLNGEIALIDTELNIHVGRPGSFTRVGTGRWLSFSEGGQYAFATADPVPQVSSNTSIRANFGAGFVTIASTGDATDMGRLEQLEAPSVDAGQVALLAEYALDGLSLRNGIALWNGRQLVPVVSTGDSAGAMRFLGFANGGDSGPSLRAGRVAFLAFTDAPAVGIFVWAAGISSQVIATGDPLFGSTVNEVRVSGSQFIDESGTVAFFYALADGREGIALARPSASTCTPVGPSRGGVPCSTTGGPQNPGLEPTAGPSSPAPTPTVPCVPTAGPSRGGVPCDPGATPGPAPTAPTPTPAPAPVPIPNPAPSPAPPNPPTCINGPSRGSVLPSCAAGDVQPVIEPAPVPAPAPVGCLAGVPSRSCVPR